MYDIVIHYESGKSDHLEGLHGVLEAEKELILFHNDPDTGEIIKEYIRYAVIEAYAITRHVVVEKADWR